MENEEKPGSVRFLIRGMNSDFIEIIDVNHESKPKVLNNIRSI
jgi:hypothetical protein